MNTQSANILTSPISLAIADSHTALRKGIINVISTFGDYFQVLIEADEGKELLSKLEEAVTCPDICLLELKLNGMSGFEALPVIKKKFPSIKILIFSDFSTDYSFLKVLKSGANGIVSKGCNTKELWQALVDVYNMGFYFSSHVPLDILTAFRSRQFSLPRITKQEKAFLSLCCTELTYQEIALEMGVGPRTVDGYRDNLFQKLGVTSRTGLIMFVVKSGIVPLPS